MNSDTDISRVPEQLGHQEMIRVEPVPDLPVWVSAHAVRGWAIPRRMAADISMGGVGIWLAPFERRGVRVGERLAIELRFDHASFRLSGWATHVSPRRGPWWFRHVLGVDFESGPRLDSAWPHLYAHLQALLRAGARRRR